MITRNHATLRWQAGAAPTNALSRLCPLLLRSRRRRRPRRLRLPCYAVEERVGAKARPSPVRKRLHHFADRLDEYLSGRVERSVLQGGNADRLSNVGQFN